MRPITSLPGFCEPIDYVVDVRRLNQAVDDFLATLFAMYGGTQESVIGDGFGTINLTHVKGLAGADRFYKFSGNKYALIKAAVEERDFTEMASEVSDSYLGEVIRAIEHQHFVRYGTKFQGRYQLIWVGVMHCYPLHTDRHTPHRYHVALKTNADCMWVFRDEDGIELMHMPADGRVWYLDPVQKEHSVANLGQTTRLHLLMTSSI